jgi:hypothetical protein
MPNERNDVYKAMTAEDVVKKLAEERDKILEAFAKAYLAESGLLPSQVEMVTQQLPMNDQNIIETIYYFRRKA